MTEYERLVIRLLVQILRAVSGTHLTATARTLTLEAMEKLE